MNFWKQLPKPFFALAPMEDVTDTVFRELVAKTASPEKLQILFTEFLSVDGFLHEVGKGKVIHRLHVSQQEKRVLNEKGIKIIAQVWGSDPEKFFKAGREISEMELFDGLDINMGCPVKKIVKNNACSALIKTPGIAKEIVLASKEGAGIPVSVKTRIGFNEVATEEWISHLLEVKPAAITVHGRTQKMQSEGLADWNEVRKAVQLRNSLNPDTLMLGNGDIQAYTEGLEKAREYEADGLMIGRGIFGNPAFFSETEDADLHQRIALLKQHISRFEEVWQDRKNYAILKRFFKIYIHSFSDAGTLRGKMMNTNNPQEGLMVIEEWKHSKKE